MADPLSGVAIIICIAFGVLTLVLLSIFANRQINRFSLKSKYCPHMPIAKGAPKSLKNEINRRLDIIKNITYQPPLLKKSDEIFFEDEYCEHMLCHLYRMKALDCLPLLYAAILSADPSKVYLTHQDYRVYLIRLAQSGLFGNIEMVTIHKFADLYEHARHDPKAFSKEEYMKFVTLMTQIRESICIPSRSRHQSLNQNLPNTSQSIESDKVSSCEKVPPTTNSSDVVSSDKGKDCETCV